MAFAPKCGRVIHNRNMRGGDIGRGRTVARGRRKRDLEAAARNILALFSGRILPFDSAAASHYAHIVAARQRSGRPVEGFDAQIASIARTRGFAVATRDSSGFELTGVAIVNPWAV